MEAGTVATTQLPDDGAGQILYEVRRTADRGRGLFALKDIAEGARIMTEEPLMVATWPQDDTSMEITAGMKLLAMTKEKQRQFLSLYNSEKKKMHPFGGIIRTNAQSCGARSQMIATFATVSLINHSCEPNTHQAWNKEKEQETIHATRPIKAGEELTIAYVMFETTAVRQATLKAIYGFTCTCPVCSKPEPARAESDQRRSLVGVLDVKISDPQRVKDEPAGVLADCAALEQVLLDEFDGKPDQGIMVRLYYDAFQVVVSHADQARGIVFAQRAHRASVLAEGEDSPGTKKMAPLASLPSSHASFKLYGAAWKCRKTRVPQGLGDEDFKKWLYKLEQ
ncbi:hypothetical protein RB598_009740 [Gaeumannomyces tritici]